MAGRRAGGPLWAGLPTSAWGPSRPKEGHPSLTQEAYPLHPRQKAPSSAEVPDPEAGWGGAAAPACVPGMGVGLRRALSSGFSHSSATSSPALWAGLEGRGHEGLRAGDSGGPAPCPSPTVPMS